MDKKLKDLTDAEMHKIHNKYFRQDPYDTCKDCPLKVKTIHCYIGLLEDYVQGVNKLNSIKELILEGSEQKVEVE